MESLLLGKISFWAQAGAVLFIIICVLLIIVILLQKGRGGGLSAAFGGAGGQSAFGSKTGDVFTWVTIVVVGVFLVMSMILTVAYVPYVEEDLNTPTLAPTGGASLPAAVPPVAPPGTSKSSPPSGTKPDTGTTTTVPTPPNPKTPPAAGG
jgi:preprotein translocase subunit SecG